MKPNEKEEALLRKSNPQRDPTPSVPPTKQPPTDFMPAPAHLPRVTATRGSKSEDDILATQMLLDAYQSKDGWKCPRCPYITTDADDFIFHLADEINKSIASLANLP